MNQDKEQREHEQNRHLEKEMLKNLILHRRLEMKMLENLQGKVKSKYLLLLGNVHN